LALAMSGCRSRATSGVDVGRTESIAASSPDAASGTPNGSTSEKPRKRTAEPPFVGTAGIVVRDASVQAAGVLRDVRTARHDGYDRVVFEFSEELPNYHLEYVDRPVRKCGSGDPTAVAGEAWLEVRLVPAHAHDERGTPTIDDRERELQLGVLRELELTCDFEAHVTWVLGLARPNRFRVLELRSPLRLVVDVRH
jgi:hypothetical protein